MHLRRYSCKSENLRQQALYLQYQIELIPLYFKQIF